MQFIPALVTAVVLCAVSRAQSPPAIQNPLESDPKAAEAGRLTFRIYCSPCHGIRAQGGRGPDLTRGAFSAGDRDSDLFRVIAGGVPGTEMSGYADTFSQENLWRLVTYVKSLKHAGSAQPAVLKGDPGSGEKLFWGKGACGQCHLVGSKGGRLGPDLSRTGRVRSLAYIRESVVAPNADIANGYYTVTVVTRDGKKIVGVDKGFDNFFARLMDSSETVHSFDKSEVVSVKREARSLMPDNYARVFSAAELDDLIAFLSNLRGAK